MGQYADISLDQVQQAQNISKEQKAAGNVGAVREVSHAVESQQPSMVKDFFAEESQKRRTSYALQDAQAQTNQMKTAMQMQRTNFDTGMKNERRLASLDASAAKTLLADEKQFKADSMGRKVLSERQLADWYNTRAATDEDWSNYQAASDQMHERRLAILAQSFKVLEQKEKQAYAMNAASLDRDTQTTIAQMKADLAKKIEDQKKKAANSSMMISALGTIGTVAGGAVGAMAGGVGAPVGAAAGGLAGAAIGKAIT